MRYYLLILEDVSDIQFIDITLGATDYDLT